MGMTLITGGGGYVGSHLARYLLREDGIAPEDLVVFDNLSTGHSELVHGGVIFVEGDLRNKKDIADVFDAHEIESVFHLAGILNVAESMEQPGMYFENNVVGGLHLLEAMVESSCRRMVFSSSCTVYGAAPSPVTESDVCEPISPYGESKLQFERLLQWYAKVYGVKAVSLRYFNAAGAAFGVGEWHEPEIHLIPSVLAAAAGGQEVAIYGTDYETADGTCVRDYVHVWDLADAHLRALEFLKGQVAGLHVFNVGSGQGSSVREIVELTEKIVGEPIRVREEARRPGDAPAMFATIDKVRAELGWKPQYTTEDCIRDAWQWLRSREHETTGGGNE